MSDPVISPVTNEYVQKTGGPAFPCEDDNRYYAGMSLRDWFAGQAIAALIIHEGRGNGDEQINYRADSAYRIADAMLRKRKNKPEVE